MENCAVKIEYFTNGGTVSFCRACLSTDRVLSTVDEYVDIFYKFFDNQDLILSDILVCWECKALLKRIRMFTSKVARAQEMLQFWYINKQAPFPDSLSTITTSEQINEINTYKEEEKPEPVKIENETDFDDQIDTFENFSETDVKEEPETKVEEETKIDVKPVRSGDENFRKSKEFNEKRLKIREGKYRFINTKLKEHRTLLVRKIPADVSEVMKNMEVERGDPVFVKAAHKCMSCVEIFDDAEKRASHQNKYHNESLKATCEVCACRVSPGALAAHLARHGRRECRACGYKSSAAGPMRRHVARHHRMVQCRACGLFFKSVRQFYEHHKALHDTFVCDECGKRCKTRQIIEKHLKHHFGYECPFCKKKLKNSATYSNHVEVQHRNSFSETAYCVQCDKRFKSDSLYRRHLAISSAHAAERATRVKRKYPCPECSNVYSRRSYMNNHYRHVHAKQSKYYCEDCDQQFLNRTKYTDHRRFKHEGAQREKNKLCNICGRGFAATRTLVNHVRTHTGERPFGCELCGAKFTQKHAMLSHVQYIHLKSKRKHGWRD
ncbi:uncharacterized protein isoform X2 [Choristoneura fumiferana]|uniref:uncharacterized protein isoform X2 n=1 Tax=Choristoneura fumiferana TaxID=7141 RepID=UPI003D15E242